MQILTINNQNFQKPSRNPSNRTKVKILKKKIWDSSSKKFGSAYAQDQNYIFFKHLAVNDHTKIFARGRSNLVGHAVAVRHVQKCMGFYI
jgi:hypothetical protein